MVLLICLCFIQESTQLLSLEPQRSGWPQISTQPTFPERPQELTTLPSGNSLTPWSEQESYFPETFYVGVTRTRFILGWNSWVCFGKMFYQVCLQQRSLSKPEMALHMIKGIPPMRAHGQRLCKQPWVKQNELEWGQGGGLRGHLSWPSDSSASLHSLWAASFKSTT